MKKLHLILSTVVSAVLILVAPLSAFALSETEWDFFDDSGIFYFDPSSATCEYSTTSYTNNQLYNGRQALSQDILSRIEANKSFYIKSAEKYGFNWQILAVVHYLEHNALRDNPGNGQGAYQLYSYTEGGKNANAFYPAGSISDNEFQRQTDIAASIIANKGSGLNLKTDNDVKLLFFKYNGTSDKYKAQARDLGFNEEEAERGEGSPYVMNLADEKRDSNKNPNWRKISRDGGPVDAPAGSRPGAFVAYSILGGSTGYSSCSTSIITSSNVSNILNQTAINLAWPERGHGLVARDTYKEALVATGVDKLGDRFSMMGASCDAFVTTVYRYSKVDPNFYCCGISIRNGKHGGTWNYVTNSGRFVEVPNTPGSLQPGDIRLSDSHIEMYVEVNGVGKIASASHGERSGDISPFYNNAGKFKAYRIKM